MGTRRPFQTRRGIIRRVSESRARVEFVGVRTPPSPTGGRQSGSCYVFKVDDREVVVRVGSRASLFGKIPPEIVERAALAFLEEEVGRRGLRGLQQVLDLGTQRMDSFVKRLQLRKRPWVVTTCNDSYISRCWCHRFWADHPTRAAPGATGKTKGTGFFQGSGHSDTA